MFVPVVDKQNKPLMPTSPARARRWVASGKATPFWSFGIWCVRLNTEPSARDTQEIAVGIDPGSKREGFTVKSEGHTYLNVQSHAVTWVKENVESRRSLRRSRRRRKTPCRQPRFSNRAYRLDRLSPSTKARWSLKLRVLDRITRVFPITHVVVEDVQAASKKGQRKWNTSFSPLEVGKQWFYDEIQRRGFDLSTLKGYETSEARKSLGLRKLKDKMSSDFHAHCVDSWVLASVVVGGIVPDNKAVHSIRPMRKQYRNLHVQNPVKGGFRKNMGSTISMGFVRGSIVRHKKYGIATVGGTSNGRISLQDINSGRRLTQDAKVSDVVFRTYNSFVFGV